MQFAELLQRIYTAYRGKTASRTPAFGTEKANIVLEIANRKVGEWARDIKHHWTSCFDTKSLTPVIDLSTFTYDLDDSFITPAKYFIVTKTDGTDVRVKLEKPEKSYCKAYISGRNPKTITFNEIDPTFDGGTIKAPAYYLPADMTAANSEVAVDDPNWLVYVVASELSRNDPAKVDQFPTLLGIANDLYQKMVDANDDLGYGQGNTIPSKMPQISPDLDYDEAFEL